MSDELVRNVASALAPIEGVRVAYVFGSQVTGRATPRSDLDVAVAYARALDAAGREDARRAAVAALTDALGRVGERADLADLERCDSGVAFRAIRDGALVLARSERERIDVECLVVRRYDDDAPRRALYLEAARRLAHGRP